MNKLELYTILNKCRINRCQVYFPFVKIFLIICYELLFVIIQKFFEILFTIPSCFFFLVIVYYLYLFFGCL